MIKTQWQTDHDEAMKNAEYAARYRNAHLLFAWWREMERYNNNQMNNHDGWVRDFSKG